MSKILKILDIVSNFSIFQLQKYCQLLLLKLQCNVLKFSIFFFSQARIQIDDSISFGFLSFGMGLLSDIDIESEVFRLLGETRYTVWAFYRIAKLQSYSGIKLSYTNLQGERISVEENDFIFIHSSWVSHIGSKIDFAPSSLSFRSSKIARKFKSL